jgi:hypothetical protein
MRFDRRLTLCAPAAPVIAIALAATAAGAGPEFTHWFPAGAQRGSTVEVAVAGNFPKWPVSAWVDRPGLAVTAGEKGKLAVSAAADAVPGVRWIRLYDTEGAAAPQPLVIGTLAEINEQEPNNAPAEAQAIGSAGIVNGRLSPGGDVDLFRVALAKGQTLVASLVGHETLDSPFDGVLQIVGPGGNVLAYNHDHGGLDPQIIFVAPADGEYLARAFAFPETPGSAIAFAGGDSYVYRLTLSTAGFVDYPWPLALSRGAVTPVELCGWNIPDELRQLSLRGEGESAVIADPRLANVAVTAVEPHAAIVEREPNDQANPQTLEMPVTVSGRMERPGDVDAFALVGKQGEALRFELASRSLGYPLDGVLEVFDSAGKSLGRADDVGNARDPVLAFVPPADGRYVLSVSDLNRHGDARHVYRLRATKATPDFSLAANAHAYQLAAGKPTEIAVSVDRAHGFAEDIHLRVVGLPDFITAAQATSAASGESAKSVKLTLQAAQGTFAGPFQIVGESAGGAKLSRTATAAIPGHAATTADLWLSLPAGASQ